MQKDLINYLEAYDNPDLNDGAYWALLEEGVMAFNSINGTDLDPHDTVLAYLTGK